MPILTDLVYLKSIEGLFLQTSLSIGSLSKVYSCRPPYLLEVYRRSIWSRFVFSVPQFSVFNTLFCHVCAIMKKMRNIRNSLKFLRFVCVKSTWRQSKQKLDIKSKQRLMRFQTSFPRCYQTKKFFFTYIFLRFKGLSLWSQNILIPQ